MWKFFKICWFFLLCEYFCLCFREICSWMAVFFIIRFLCWKVSMLLINFSSFSQCLSRIGEDDNEALGDGVFFIGLYELKLLLICEILINFRSESKIVYLWELRMKLTLLLIIGGTTGILSSCLIFSICDTFLIILFTFGLDLCFIIITRTQAKDLKMTQKIFSHSHHPKLTHYFIIYSNISNSLINT